MTRIHESWKIGDVEIPNRAVLAPLAGIGNWFVRLQANRYGAGLAVSEMVSSFGLKYGDARTHREFLVLHPDERPTSVQLFGGDPGVMREAAAIVAQAGASIIDLNMGCPVKKVCKTGAGSALLKTPDLAVEVARAAREGGGLPVTVKLRPGDKPGDREGVELAHRLIDEAGVSAISFHPRHASQQHKGLSDYKLARDVVESLSVPVMISGGITSAAKALQVLDQTGAAAVMFARGSLGNPWIFEQALGAREGQPAVEEVLDELDWVLNCAEQHFGEARAARYLRKFYPWYLERINSLDAVEMTKSEINRINQRLQQTGVLRDARAIFRELALPAAA